MFSSVHTISDEQNTTNPIIAIFGPTASGKSSLSVALAKRLDGEIVNMDSMQIYRGLSVGTAAPKPEEMGGIPHHLYQMIDVCETFTVADYRQRALEVIKDIRSRGKAVILTGGTGLYLSSLYFDFSFRETIEQTFEVEADENRFDVKNPRRLERFQNTGTVHLKDHRQKSSLQIKIFWLNIPREVLQERIFQRIHGMIEAGILQETAWLFRDKCPEQMIQARAAIGYKELWPYLQGQQSLEEATFKLLVATRRYAKRQVTWVKHQYPEVTMLDGLQSPEELIRQIERNL